MYSPYAMLIFILIYKLCTFEFHFLSFLAPISVQNFSTWIVTQICFLLSQHPVSWAIWCGWLDTCIHTHMHTHCDVSKSAPYIGVISSVNEWCSWQDLHVNETIFLNQLTRHQSRNRGRGRRERSCRALTCMEKQGRWGSVNKTLLFNIRSGHKLEKGQKGLQTSENKAYQNKCEATFVASQNYCTY